jgi:hypothetical protein
VIAEFSDRVNVSSAVTSADRTLEVTITSTPGKVFVYQIFYNEESREALDPGFIPLDNTKNERPDWYEFWVIRTFLKEHPLREDAWYGFLSPKFVQKTGVRSASLLQALEMVQANADIVLAPYSWDQLAYFQNPFEQGEFWHPGLLSASQQLFDEIGCKVDLSQLVSHSESAAFSNFLVARSSYWIEWLELADRFFELVEGDFRRGIPFRSATSYGSREAQVPMKTFVQERFPAVILSRRRYRVARIDIRQGLFERLFTDDAQTYRALLVCDFLKQRYCHSGDEEFLRMYRKVRGDIRIKTPAK